MSRRIALTRGEYAIVDHEDYIRLSQFKWQCTTNARGYKYAVRTEILPNGSRRCIRMHREILDLTPNDLMDADHVNGDGLDNRRCNLRLATRSQNCANSNRNPGIAGFRGVRPSGGNRNPWRAQISDGGKMKHLGVFSTAKEAALAYDGAAKERYGKFAVLNFSD